MTPDNELITRVVEAARDNLRSSEMLAPVFFIGDDSRIGMLPADFSDDSSKDRMAHVVKELVKQVSAEFVLFIAESWTIKDQDAAREYMENMDAYNGVSSHPKAVEVVTFMLETKNKAWMAVTDILPDREMGAVEWKESSMVEGRFSGFFGEMQIKH